VDIIPLIENLEIGNIFKDKDKEERDSIIETLSIILRLLGEELEVAS
jgi:hypothetical protein